jgi:hypothetical protein
VHESLQHLYAPSSIPSTKSSLFSYPLRLPAPPAPLKISTADHTPQIYENSNLHGTQHGLISFILYYSYITCLSDIASFPSLKSHEKAKAAPKMLYTSRAESFTCHKEDLATSMEGVAKATRDLPQTESLKDINFQIRNNNCKPIRHFCCFSEFPTRDE